jgi:Zn finger protein HypA/HybF involved in hydrogenase expression
MPKKISTEDFVKKSIIVHGNKYSYEGVRYMDARTKVRIFCKKHGKFSQTPDNHLHGIGCPKCGHEQKGKTQTQTNSTFETKAKQIHANQYSYEEVIYKGAFIPVKIICRVHGSFSQTPHDHLAGRGCQDCSIVRRTSTTRNFIANATKVHGTIYSYKETEYVNSRTEISITCKTHGTFSQRPDTHLRGSGCPGCNSTRYSRIAIKWIEEYAYSHRLKSVQHAQNGGEFRIPGTRYLVDGYHKPSNTVFEFYGDCFHGNPKTYRPTDKCNPFSDFTAKQLFNETLRREKELKCLGYKVVSIWENEYRSLN